MQEVFNWLSVNYRLVIDAVIAIAALVLFIVRKKPVSDLGYLISAFCFQGVLLAEKSSSKGNEKLQIAIKYVEDCLLSQFPDMDITRYRKTIVECIELILKTPQKKGEK